jgi:hypothetical protein
MSSIFMVSISRKLFYKDHIYIELYNIPKIVYKVRVITIVINRGGANVSQLLINRERVFKREYYLISEYKIVNKNLLYIYRF